MDADKREEQKEVSEKSIKGLHILLAEDNELNMEIAEFMLQNEGADVIKAWNGQEAVELFRKSEPGEFDVILMDIMMPVMNGYEATKMIRSLDRESKASMYRKNGSTSSVRPRQRARFLPSCAAIHEIKLYHNQKI